MMIQIKTRVLTAQDRCELCNATAKVVATFLNGELTFCGHHAREIKESLKEKAITIYDPENEINLLK